MLSSNDRSDYYWLPSLAHPPHTQGTLQTTHSHAFPSPSVVPSVVVHYPMGSL